MVDGSARVTMSRDAPIVIALREAVHRGDVEATRGLISDQPDLAVAHFESRGGSGTALHVVTDWPGYFPNGPALVHLLIDAGADPNAVTTPSPGETPLHYAASSDDLDVATALIDRGADVATPGGSIGTPLDNAVGYACWNVARLLVNRGAPVEKIWHAAGLGMLDRLHELLATPSDPDRISQGFWHACAAGQRRAAEFLLGAGADLNWEPDYAHGTPLDAAQQHGTQRSNVIQWLQCLDARSADTNN